MQSDCCHSPGEQYTLTQLKKIRLSCICLFYYDTRLRNFGTQCLVCPECSSFFNHLFVFCCCCCCCCCCFKWNNINDISLAIVCNRKIEIKVRWNHRNQGKDWKARRDYLIINIWLESQIFLEKECKMYQHFIVLYEEWIPILVSRCRNFGRYSFSKFSLSKKPFFWI